jgi:ankyrin repeat protein
MMFFYYVIIFFFSYHVASESSMIDSCFKGDLPQVKDFIEKKVAINTVNKDGLSPLIAAIKGYESIEDDLSSRDCCDLFSTIMLLLDNGADVNIVNKDGLSPLISALQSYKSVQERAKSPRMSRDLHTIIILLLNKRARVLVSCDSITPFMLACASGNSVALLRMIELLDPLERNVLNAQDSAGKTALHYAIEKRSMHCLEIFKDYTVSTCHKECSRGLDELMMALEMGDPGIIKIVASLPYRRFNCDRQSNTIFHYLARFPDQAHEFFRRFGGNEFFSHLDNELNFEQISRGNFFDWQRRMIRRNPIAEGMKFYQDIKSTLLLANSDGDTPLHLAVKNRSKNCLRLFLLLGGPNIVLSKDPEGRSPLDVAFKQSSLLMLDEFLAFESTYPPVTPHASYFRVVDQEGNTSAQRALLGLDISVLPHFRGKKIGIDACNYSGETPLHLAVKENRPDLLDALIRYYKTIPANRARVLSSDVEQFIKTLLIYKNKEGLSCVDIAKICSPDCLKILNKCGL